MRSTSTAVCTFLLLHVANHTNAQGVLIHRAAPAAVVERLKAQLLPQGFKLERADDKSTLFTLDRGMVAQRADPFRGALVHIVIEVLFRFKPKSDGLVVTASEETVGERGRPLEFRKPVESRAERDNLQRLLDSAQADLETVPQPGDSLVKRDSGGP